MTVLRFIKLRPNLTTDQIRNSILFCAIVITASILRFYDLGDTPAGMTWDEAAIGYNGFSIVETRRDEWLERLPVSFRSFGDYKAPLAIYINGLFTLVLGMSVWAVRVPFAISGIISVVGIVWLVRELLEDHAHRNELSLFSGFLLGLSPWHIYYSRVGLESGIALSFSIWGLFVILRTLNTQHAIWKKFLYFLIGLVLLVAALYTYHSAKIVVPLLVISLVVTYWRRFLVNVKVLLLSVLLSSVLLVPLVKDSIYGEGLTRASVTIFTSVTDPVQIISNVSENYLAHIDPDFLLFGRTTTLRHGGGEWGLLLPTTFFLVVFGLISLVWQNQRKVLLLGSMWVIIGLLPAAIGTEVPHSNRALFALLGFIILAVSGLESLLRKVDNKKMTLGLVIMIHLLCSITFIEYYFNRFDALAVDDFQAGYIEAFTLAEEYEKGLNGKPTVDKIIFTSKYGQPYIYALFVRKTNPIWYQGGSLVKYEFRDTITASDLAQNSTLVITHPIDGVNQLAQHTIYGKDGSIRFLVYYND